MERTINYHAIQIMLPNILGKNKAHFLEHFATDQVWAFNNYVRTAIERSNTICASAEKLAETISIQYARPVHTDTTALLVAQFPDSFVRLVADAGAIALFVNTKTQTLRLFMYESSFGANTTLYEVQPDATWVACERTIDDKGCQSRSNFGGFGAYSLTHFIDQVKAQV
jgi:hypothetical protein